MAAAELAANTRCENVVLLDLRGRSPVTEFFVIATGTSPRQMRTVVDEVRDLGKTMGFRAWQTSGYESARWILVDCVNVVCHLFDTDSRDFYDLELLWGDCPRIDWRKELGLPPASELRDASSVSTQERFREAAGMDNLDAEQEDARLDGRDLDAEEGDADMDEDAETDAPVVMEFADESTGSNSVEFVEIDPPSKRLKRGRAVYPTPIGDQDESEEESVGMQRASDAGLAGANESLDEDDQERDAEAAADRDPEAVSEEDLPDERMESRPMGGVSANMTGGTIVEQDEESQSGAPDLEDAEQDHKDDVPEAYEAASEGTTFAKPVGDQPGVDVDAESDAQRSTRGKVLKNRTKMRAPRESAPGPVNVQKAKMAVKTGGRKSREGSIADAPEPAKGKLPVRKMSKASAKTGSARGNTAGKKAAGGKKVAAKKAAVKKPATKAAPKKAAGKKPAAKKPAAKAKAKTGAKAGAKAGAKKKR